MRRLVLVFVAFALAYGRHQCDPESTCEEEETCCKLSDDVWGCCPMRNAICCEDHLHCCPPGTRCDVQESRCVQSDNVFLPLARKRPASKIPKRNEHNEIICPDRSSKCPDQTTCCQLKEGFYGCCPAPEAVCCADELHCCPHGYTCKTQMCVNRVGKWAPLLKKFPSTTIRKKAAVDFLSGEDVTVDNDDDIDDDSDESALPNELKPIACGDRKTCPASSTCCAIRTEYGQYKHMCCPLSNAVCCTSTCCPRGYRCAAGGKCEKHASRFQFDFQ